MSAVQGRGELPVPEEMEIETQDIDETVHEAIERESSWLLKAISLTLPLRFQAAVMRKTRPIVVPDRCASGVGADSYQSSVPQVATYKGSGSTDEAANFSRMSP